MEDNSNANDSIWERVEQLGLTTLELSKLKALQTVTNVTTGMVTRVSVIIALLLFLLILNIGIAFQLGEALGNTSYGFFIVAVFYLISAIVLHFYLYRWIRNSISELIIDKALQQIKQDG